MDFYAIANANIVQLLQQTVKEITLLLSWYKSAPHADKTFLNLGAYSGVEQRKCFQNFSQHKGFNSSIVLCGTHSIHVCLPKYVDVELVGQKDREK